jgi:hypothetical protein
MPSSIGEPVQVKDYGVDPPRKKLLYQYFQWMSSDFSNHLASLKPAAM